MRLLVFLYIVFPARFRHVALVVETLLAKELDGVVVRVSQQILDALFLRIVLEHVHQA